MCAYSTYQEITTGCVVFYASGYGVTSRINNNTFACNAFSFAYHEYIKKTAIRSITNAAPRTNTTIGKVVDTEVGPLLSFVLLFVFLRDLAATSWLL